MEKLQHPELHLIRKVRFPIKLKFTLMLILFLVATMTLFLVLASKLIQEDKAAYIYDSILQRTEEKAAILQSNMLKWRTLLESKSASLANYPEIIAFEVEGKFIYLSPQFSLDQIPHFASGQPVQSIFLKEQPVLVLDQSDQKTKIYIDFKQTSASNSPFLEMIVDSTGHSITRSGQHLPWINELNKQSALSGSLRRDEEIIGFVKIPEFNWILVSSIKESKAFAVAGYMISKSFYFALLILGIAIIVGILAVRPLTSQLERLTQSTEKMGQGDFTQLVVSKSSDEIGALSDSFNIMNKKILAFMEEMKEKARLESEMKVAQLVQNAFIPPQTQRLGSTQILSFTTPATECGGDWWGMLEFGDRQIFIIADATGHGVPAALLTATINACKESLKVLFEKDPELAQSPARMMSYLNRVISHSGDQIQMTCFLATWHLPSRTLIYSNASHQPALLYIPPKEGEPSKQNIRPLLEANGPRLGQDLEALFSENYVELPSGVSMWLYTDGMLEAQGPDGQVWGQRRFLNSLLQAMSTDGHPQIIIDDLQAFHQSSQYEDDVTLVHVRF
jgi:phosphoserine phosphatase RsbU/P